MRTIFVSLFNNCHYFVVLQFHQLAQTENREENFTKHEATLENNDVVGL